MHIDINGHSTFVSTGGRAFDPKGEVLLFIHGSGQSHLSWVLQSRFFANRGWQVLAPDLPGHNLSNGDPLPSCEAVADWCADLLTAAEVEQATVIGHSQGGLVALDMAARHPSRVKKLAVISAAQAIPVNDFLIDLATNSEEKAIRFMVSWSHATEGHKFDHSMPGQSHLLFGKEVMGQNKQGILLNDLNACNAYTAGP
ncbi:MAG: alpha/beta fold hydrolase, partial [Boseongicola sp.]